MISSAINKQSAVVYYTLITDTRIEAKELYDYRTILSGLEGRQHENWHNHDLSSGKSIHQYPLIQYKILEGRLAIVAQGSEKETLFRFASKLPLRFFQNGQPSAIDFFKLEKHQHWPGLTPRGLIYRSNNWVPMDSDRYGEFKRKCEAYRLPYDSREVSHPALLGFFAGLLHQQVVQHAHSLGAPFDGRFLKIKILNSYLEHGLTDYYDNKFSIIKNLKVALNYNWPHHLGIGKGTAIGYGMFTRQ